jgi:dihydroflavonol-4-reductase
LADTVLLTGITGFLGGHLARELLQSGYHVRGSLRNPDRADATRDALWEAGADVSRLDFVTLDLTRDEGWDEAARGARFVMHSASPFVTTMPKNPDDLIAPAVNGTERAMSAARRAGVERVVLTSSSVAIMHGTGSARPQSLGPDDWADLSSGASAYAISKTLAERRAWEMAKDGPDLAVINPGFILGPLLDNDPGTSGAIIQRFLRGNIPVSPRLYMHMVDVRDLARIHVAALTDPDAAGKRHLSAFESVALGDIAVALARGFPAYARKMPKFIAPNWFVRLYALFDGDARSSLNDLGYNPHLDTRRGLRLLGRPPLSADEAIRAMAQSLLDRRLA